MGLIDYLTILGNFDTNYMESGLYSNGYFDLYNIDTKDIVADSNGTIGRSRVSVVDNRKDDDQIFELQYAPGVGLLNSAVPLLPGCEVKLSFDRATVQLALVQKTLDEIQLDKKLALTNLYCKARYYSSPYLRRKFDSIKEKDLHYNYDECSVYLKNLPKGETNIRMNNIFGGNTPTHIFCGVIRSEALTGNSQLSATRFQRHFVKEANLTLNGYSCSGYPLSNVNGSALPAYMKYLQTTNRKFNTDCGRQIAPLDFKNFHFLYSHEFEGDQTEQGWIGLELKLEKPFEDNFTLGKLLIIC